MCHGLSVVLILGGVVGPRPLNLLGGHPPTELHPSPV
jgi:hypothetical protein